MKSFSQGIDMDRIIANRYQILNLIGQGSMGSVYMAEDKLLQRVVAIKMVLQNPSHSASQFETDPGSTDFAELKIMLMNEAQMMARIQHPNVMPIYDLIQEDDAIYIVMPIVMGRWNEFEAKAGERPLVDIIRLLQRIADGLDFVHNHQIIHRDLKPENIFIGEDNQPYIADFGLAQELDISELDESEAVAAGTLAYIAPEILTGDKASHLSDIFSFGIMIYNLITGDHPFRRSNVAETITGILTKPLPSIKEFRPELSEAMARDVDKVIGKLTAKDPEQRYSNASEAVDELYRSIFSGQQVIEGKLFISYARVDHPFVYPLADELQRFNVDLWIDRNIEYGANWDESIDNQLKDCDAMLLIATPASMQSSFVTYEWSYFLGANKPVLPFVPHMYINDVNLHPRLQRIQFIKGAGDISKNTRDIIEVMRQAIANRKKQHD